MRPTFNGDPLVILRRVFLKHLFRIADFRPWLFEGVRHEARNIESRLDFRDLAPGADYGDRRRDKPTDDV